MDVPQFGENTMQHAKSIKILQAKLAYRESVLNRLASEDIRLLKESATIKSKEKKAATIERNRLKEIKRLYAQHDAAIARRKLEVIKVQENRTAKNLARIAATAARRLLRKEHQS